MPEHSGPISLPLCVRNGTVARCQLHVYAGRETYQVLEFGDVEGKAEALVRIESACTFAHLYGSALCDCQAQLDKAIQILAKAESGLLIYALDQHGRGIGLLRHVQVYEREEMGYDTVEAHESLSLPVDARLYDEIVEILKKFQLRHILLLTNNPSRIEAIQTAGIAVTRVPLEVSLNIYNCRELMIKKERLGHLLSFVSDREWVHSLRTWYSDVGGDGNWPWMALLVTDFQYEVTRMQGDSSTIQCTIDSITSQLMESQSVLSIYLVGKLQLHSGTPLDLRSLAPIASRTRVILSGKEARTHPDRDAVMIPKGLRELKVL